MAAYPDYTDHQLLILISEGDEQAFAQFFYKYTAYLQPYVYSLTKSEPLTEEVIQETFLRIWINRDRLGEVENLKAWIFRIAANECYNYFRRKEVEHRVYSHVGYQEELRQKEPNDTLSFSEVKLVIQEAIDQMSQQRRKIYKLSREEGLKISEIADQLGLSVQTVKNTLSAALENIRQYLIKRGFNDVGIILIIFFMGAI